MNHDKLKQPLQHKKIEEKKKPEIQPKKPSIQPQKKQQQQPQQIKIDDVEIPEKEIKNKMDPEDTKVFITLKDIYKFSYKDQSGISRAYYGDYLFVVRKISDRRKDYNKKDPYVVVRIKKGDDEKIIEKKDDEKILIPYFRFNNEFFNTKGNREKFIKFIKDDKYKFDKIIPDGNFNSEDIRSNGILNFKTIKSLKKIPNNDIEKIFPDGENNDGLFDDEGFDDEDNEEKPIEEKPIEEKKEEPLPKKEKFEIEDDYTDSERMKDTDTEGMTDTDEEELLDADVRGKDNQLILRAPDGNALRTSIKYNGYPDSLLKLIVSLSNDNKGEVDFKEIGEIQDLNGDITNLYSDMQDLKTKINSSNNAEEKERLLIKYNKKRLKLEDLIKKYSKEAYRLSTLNKKKKATFSNPKYIKNKLSKL